VSTLIIQILIISAYETEKVWGAAGEWEMLRKSIRRKTKTARRE